MASNANHPLDIELFDHVVGDSDPALAQEIDGHLETCIPCRVRIGRIRQSNPTPVSRVPYPRDLPQPSPLALRALKDLERPDTPEPGQVWLAGSSRRVLLWVRAVRETRVVAHPMTLDVPAVDDSALIVDDLEALGQPAAIVTSLVGTARIDQFVAYLGELNVFEEVEALRDAAVTGVPIAGHVTTGTPIESPADERLEFRQLLADDLALLDVPEDEDDEREVAIPAVGAGQEDPSVRGILELLQADVVERRGGSCLLALVTNPSLTVFAESVGCIPVAHVRELDCSVLVVTGLERVAWALDSEHDTTRLMWYADASALAVAEPSEPFDTCVFEARDLHSAFELPDATRHADPRVGYPAKPVAKAIYDFFENSAFPVQPPAAFSARPERAHLTNFLSSQANTAISALRGTRAQLSKNVALKALTDEDASMIAAAVEASDSADSLVAEIDRIAES